MQNQMNTTFAADFMLKAARTHADAWAKLAETVSATPFAPFAKMTADFHAKAVDGFEQIATSFAGAAEFDREVKKATGKSTRMKTPSIAKTAKPMMDVMKKAIDTQADLLTSSSATVVDASAKAAEATDRIAEDVKSGDTVALYDDLTEVTGIGPSTMRKLNDAGIRSLRDLADMSASKLNDVLEEANIRMLRYEPQDWIDGAKELLKKNAA